MIDLLQMTERHTQAKKKYWSELTIEQRSILMSQRRKKGWRKKTKAERLAHGRTLTDNRIAKEKSKLSTP